MRGRVLCIAGLVVAAILLPLAPVLATIYGEAYPANIVKREALARCGCEEPGFNRLFAADRARCYARLLEGPPPGATPVPRRLQVAQSGASLPLFASCDFC